VVDRSREGRRIAGLFRQSRGITDVRACDLDAILTDRQLEIAESDHLEPGYSALLFRAGEGGGIMLAAGQPPGRRRFSIAHELGHFLIPSHERQGIEGYCLSLDMRARSYDARTVEWEANDFAAELLMPQRLFRADAARMEPSVANIETLAGPDYYGVSRLAAAWRHTEVSARAAAVVLVTDRRVTWIVRSEAFELPLTERQQFVHPETLASAAFRGEGVDPRPQLVNAGVWLDRSVPVTGDLYESTYAIPSLNQVASILWHDEDGSEDA
jgi:hypothetical protein